LNGIKKSALSKDIKQTEMANRNLQRRQKCPLPWTAVGRELVYPWVGVVWAGTLGWVWS